MKTLALYRGLFITSTNIQHKALCNNNWRLLAIHFCCKALHLRSLRSPGYASTGVSSRTLYGTTKLQEELISCFENRFSEVSDNFINKLDTNKLDIFSPLLTWQNHVQFRIHYISLYSCYKEIWTMRSKVSRSQRTKGNSVQTTSNKYNWYSILKSQKYRSSRPGVFLWIAVILTLSCIRLFTTQDFKECLVIFPNAWKTHLVSCFWLVQQYFISINIAR